MQQQAQPHVTVGTDSCSSGHRLMQGTEGGTKEGDTMGARDKPMHSVLLYTSSHQQAQGFGEKAGG